MRTAVVLFTRDLRVHDHAALHAACRDADVVVPLFVLDDRILRSRYAAPNRVAALLEALADLRASLRDRGGELLVRRGDLVDEVREVITGVSADELHLSADVSRYAERRLAALADLGRALDVRIATHPGVVLVGPGDITPAGRDHFRVFTPYWHRWIEHPHRDPLPAPARVPTPPSLVAGAIPARADLVAGREAPHRLRTGEGRAREQLERWLATRMDGYDDARDDLAADGTSRLSVHLHLGCLSVAEVAGRLDRRRAGHDAFLRQLCWRDFDHQLLAANPDLPRTDLRTQYDVWREDDEAFDAWCTGRTGYPVVDAGMRQLACEGWMHNRARMFNPVAQSRRYDPTGAYIRRYVTELRAVDDRAVHAPWEADGLLATLDYPPPIVDHGEARERFLSARAR